MYHHKFLSLPHMLLHLYDKHCRVNLLPFTYTRTSADVRVGILTLREKWEQLYQCQTSSITEEYLQELFTIAEVKAEDAIVIANIVANDEIVQWLKNAQKGDGLYYNEILIAAKGISSAQFENEEIANKHSINELTQINFMWDIFSLNDKCLRADYAKLTAGRTSADIGATNILIGNEIFAEEGAKVALLAQFT
jgi:hypothetical protein